MIIECTPSIASCNFMFLIFQVEGQYGLFQGLNYDALDNGAISMIEEIYTKHFNLQVMEF